MRMGGILSIILQYKLSCGSTQGRSEPPSRYRNPSVKLKCPEYEFLLRSTDVWFVDRTRQEDCSLSPNQPHLKWEMNFSSASLLINYIYQILLKPQPVEN